MDNLETIIPVTALIAILLFIFREVIDLIKKYKSKNAEVRTYKKLIARELEENLWTYKVVFRTIKEVKQHLEEFPNPHFSLIYTHDARVLFRVRRMGEGTELTGGHSLVNTKHVVFDRIIIQLANSDASFFDLIQDAYDAILDLESLRNALIGYIQKEDPINVKYIEGWFVYALEQEQEIFKKMDAAYQKCANKPLTEHRL